MKLHKKLDEDLAEITSKLKAVIYSGKQCRRYQYDALDQICLELANIVVGANDSMDTWRNISHIAHDTADTIVEMCHDPRQPENMP